MSEIETGGPAFPFAFTDESRVSDGMTLRDYFAAKAMHAMVRGALHGTVFGDTDEGARNCAIYADVAYSMADAMLAARGEK